VATVLPDATGAALGDMFLFVKGAKSGVIKGEAQDATHAEEIDVVSWSWGMQSKSSLGSTVPAGRATVNELKIVKRIDSASTPLMHALRSNEPIIKAVLTLRKSGKGALEFFKITIEQGRVTTVNIDAGGDRAGTPDVFEEVRFTFNKITVEYVPQGKDGLARGSTMYQDEFGES
jgi:type VI secretion system secreted protein Hcp